MKLSAWHKRQGDSVEWALPMLEYDRVYMCKVFDDSPDQITEFKGNPEIIRGGTGYNKEPEHVLPNEIEHIMPDYSLYGITDTAFGFLTRGCPRGCGFCGVSHKEGRISHKVADLSEWWSGQKNIKLLDPNLLACKNHIDLLGQLVESRAEIDITQGFDARMLTESNINLIKQMNISMIHFAWDLMKESDRVIEWLKIYKEMNPNYDKHKTAVYVLVNYDTTIEEDLFRIYKLRELGFMPYVMIYNKANATKIYKRLQRWTTNRFIWFRCKRFEDYKA